MSFLETASRTPSAVRAWWYPGERTGYEFIYPRAQARQLAQATGASVLTTKSDTTKSEETRTGELTRIDASGRDQDAAASVDNASSREGDRHGRSGRAAAHATSGCTAAVAFAESRTQPSARRAEHAAADREPASARRPDWNAVACGVQQRAALAHEQVNRCRGCGRRGRSTRSLGARDDHDTTDSGIDVGRVSRSPSPPRRFPPRRRGHNSRRGPNSSSCM